jgi:hypothetical protein
MGDPAEIVAYVYDAFSRDLEVVQEPRSGAANAAVGRL